MVLQLEKTNAFFIDRKLAIAGGAAIILHGFLLLQTLPLSKVLNEDSIRSLSIELSTSENIKPEPNKIVSQDTPVKDSSSEPVSKIDPSSKNGKPPADEVTLTAPANENLTSSRFSAWVEQETNTHVRSKPQALDEFSQSFAARPTGRAPQQESYVNAYGQTHVVTRIGDRDVCYMDSNQHIKDDWSAGVVMFYDCDTRDETKFELP